MRPSRALAIALLLASAACLDAKGPQLPKTPAGKRLASMLRAFNDGDERVLRHFVEDNYAASALKQRPVEDRFAAYSALYRETRGLELRSLGEVSDTSITVIAQTRLTQEWLRITCAVDAAAPHGITGVLFGYIPRPAELGPHVKMSPQEIAGELDRYLEKLARAGNFSGVVGMATRGNTVYLKAFGKANSHALTTNSTLGLASISKTFTAVAVAQLEEAGKLSFHDPISKYFPAFPRPRGDQITIRQLLTHTAGLESFLDLKSLEEVRKANLRTQQDWAEFLGKRSPVSAPGKAFHYSNADYWLLDLIVEMIANESIGDYLEAHVFHPLGMQHTQFGSSTAPDLLRFAEGLRTAKLLSPEMTAELFAPKVATEDPETQYGYGVEVETVNGTRVVGHTGEGPNVSARLDIYPDSGYTVAILSPRQGDIAPRLANKLRELITQK
jgi:CubicO group peptidase (beta-lactamase class C family)